MSKLPVMPYKQQEDWLDGPVDWPRHCPAIQDGCDNPELCKQKGKCHYIAGAYAPLGQMKVPALPQDLRATLKKKLTKKERLAKITRLLEISVSSRVVPLSELLKLAKGD